MLSPTAAPSLDERAELALADAFLRRAVRFTSDRLRNAKQAASAKLGRWEEWRARAKAVRTHTIENLDHYLSTFLARAQEHGIQVHFAADAEEARAWTLAFVREKGVKLAVKSKSMVTEEVHLNQALAGAGVETLETDLGEWIVQLAGETPSHIILPAIHKSRAQIQHLFETEGGAPLSSDTRTLAAFARRRLRERFLSADLGISGGNFLVAETGSIAIFTNEGNGRMVTSLPRLHVAFVGLERIVPTWDDLELMANILPRSATGQPITTYLNVLGGPRGAGEHDGPEELHVVVLDNGRSRQLGDARYQEILNCIRCGACLNVCPVYRQIGGHAYGSVYPGPIGAVLTPLLAQEEPRARELADASSLCGACHEACPVDIPLEDLLVRLRGDNARVAPPAERRLARVLGFGLAHPRLYHWGGKLARLAARESGGDGGAGALGRALHPWIAGWLAARELPVPPKASFREQWRELEREERP